MLIVTIELAPGGDVSRKRRLGIAHIINDATGDVDTGNYRVTLFKWGESQAVWKRGTVRGFPRRKLGPYDLLCRALTNTVGGRNHEPPA